LIQQAKNKMDEIEENKQNKNIIYKNDLISPHERSCKWDYSSLLIIKYKIRLTV
jgi:hypothetical protein